MPSQRIGYLSDLHDIGWVVGKRIVSENVRADGPFDTKAVDQLSDSSNNSKEMRLEA
jgi:hypothetical protein